MTCWVKDLSMRLQLVYLLAQVERAGPNDNWEYKFLVPQSCLSPLQEKASLSSLKMPFVGLSVCADVLFDIPSPQTSSQLRSWVLMPVPSITCGTQQPLPAIPGS